MLFGLIEYGYLTDISKAIAYQLLQRDKNHSDTSVELIRTSITFMDLILILILQIRIEYDHIVIGDQNGCCVSICKFVRQKLHAVFCLHSVQDSFESSNGKIYYNLKVIRGFFAVGIITAIVLGYHLTIGNSDTRNNYVLLYGLYAFVCPWIFAWHHQGMKTMAMNKLKYFYPSPLFNISER